MKRPFTITQTGDIWHIYPREGEELMIKRPDFKDRDCWIVCKKDYTTLTGIKEALKHHYETRGNKLGYKAAISTLEKNGYPTKAKEKLRQLEDQGQIIVRRTRGGAYIEW